MVWLPVLTPSWMQEMEARVEVLLPCLSSEKHVPKEASLCVALGTQAWASGRVGMVFCLVGRSHGSSALAGRVVPTSEKAEEAAEGWGEQEHPCLPSLGGGPSPECVYDVLRCI